jgi:hypothetical protein
LIRVFRGQKKEFEMTKPSKKIGNTNALKRGNDAMLTVACTRREKAAWVKAAPGTLSDWVREQLNGAVRE